MFLTILGSGGILPDPERMGPSYLVSHDDTHLLLDVGPGSLRSLARIGKNTGDVRGLCVTHRHPDHTSEFRLFIDLERSNGRTSPLLLAGTHLVDELLEFHLNWGRLERANVAFPFDRLLTPGEGTCGPFAIESEPVPHVDHSVGYRVTAGSKTLVYAGDCGPGEQVVHLARNADLLILEATLPIGQESAAHLSPEHAAEIALRANCKRLVLTHFPPGADTEAAVSFCQARGIDTVAAVDLLQIEV
jgi:ribonuclease BN (tRNA processing enzyme)